MKRWALCLVTALVTAGCSTPFADGTLAGRVVVTGETALGGIAVTTVGPRAVTVHTDADGHYQLAGLVESTYAVSATPPSTVEGTQSVLVDASGLTTVPDLVFTPVGRLHGRATRGGAATGNAGIVVTVAGSSAAVVTDDSGDYALDAVPTGPRSIMAQATGYKSAVASGLDVTWNQTTSVPELDLSIGPGHAGLHGIALLYGQSDHHGTLVTIVGTGLTTTTAVDGTWAIDNVPEGTYALTFANGIFAETVPQVVALAGSDGFVVDQSLYALERSPLTLYAASRVRSVTLASVQYSYGPDFLLSPDGTRILYVDPTTDSLMLTPLDGSATVTLTVSYQNSLGYNGAVFTADSQRVVFYSGNRLQSVSVQGGAPNTLAAGVSLFGVAPKGNLLFYWGIDPVSGVNQLNTMPVTGGTPTLIETDNNFSGPVWSADGSHIIYRTDLDSYYEEGTLKLAAASGGSPIVLGGGAAQPILSPDGNYALDEIDGETGDFSGSLLAVNLSTGAANTLTQGLSYYNGYRFAAGGRVVFGLTSGDLDSSPAFGGSATTLGHGNGFTLSGDLTTVAFTSCGATCQTMAGPVGGPVQVVAGYGQFLTLSNDGTQLLYGVDTNNAQAAPLYVVPVGGGHATMIDPLAYQEGTARVTPDEQHVIYWTNVTANPYGTLHLYSLIDGSSTALVDSAYAYSWSFAPDGKHLALNVQPSATQPMLLTVTPLDGSPAVPVLDALGPGPVWMPNGSLLAVRTGTQAPYRFQDGIYRYTP